MKQTPEEWKALTQKVGIIDPVIQKEEEDRRKKIEMEIMMNAGAVEDRQSINYWREHQQLQEQKKREEEKKIRLKKEKKEQRKKMIVSLLTGKNKPASTAKPARQTTRPATRTTGKPARPMKKPVPNNPEDFMPDFNMPMEKFKPPKWG